MKSGRRSYEKRLRREHTGCPPDRRRPGRGKSMTGQMIGLERIVLSLAFSTIVSFPVSSKCGTCRHRNRKTLTIYPHVMQMSSQFSEFFLYFSHSMAPGAYAGKGSICDPDTSLVHRHEGAFMSWPPQGSDNSTSCWMDIGYSNCIFINDRFK